MVDNNQNLKSDPPGPCPPTTTVPLSPFTSATTPVFTGGTTATRIKVPVVLAEPTIQIPIEAIIPTPGATEIKRVKKNVFLDQVKIVPVAPFTRLDGTDYFSFATFKLFVAGHIRKDIEYTTAGAAAGCTVGLTDRVVDIPFSGFTEITGAAVLSPPIFGISENAEANFVSRSGLNARLDKYFFQNLVKYNEQPFGELVAANFYELDFSPTATSPEGVFNTMTEKLVLELTVKVLQTQQLAVALPTVVPVLPGLTPPTTTP